MRYHQVGGCARNCGTKKTNPFGPNELMPVIGNGLAKGPLKKSGRSVKTLEWG